jgi:hypothetical protein
LKAAFGAAFSAKSKRKSLSAEFDKFIAVETEKWGRVVKFANIQPE